MDLRKRKALLVRGVLDVGIYIGNICMISRRSFKVLSQELNLPCNPVFIVNNMHSFSNALSFSNFYYSDTVLDPDLYV